MVVGSGAHASGIGPVVSRYAVAVALVLVATIVRMPLQPLLGDTVPFLVFFPAIAATAWYAGLGAGMLATLLSAVIALSLFAPFSTREASRVTLVLPTALFLGFGKRRHELASAANAGKQRAALEAYSPRALTFALAATGIATIATYLAYTLDHDTQRFFQNPWLWATTIHPLFGVIRFLQLGRGVRSTSGQGQ